MSKLFVAHLYCLVIGIATCCAQSVNRMNKNSYSFLPVAYYTPETRLAGGVFANLHLRSHLKDSLTRSTDITASFTATQNKQLAWESNWVYFSNKEKIFISGRLDALRFPQYFFGVGKTNERGCKYLYSSNLINLENKVLYNIHKRLYGGLYTKAQYLFDVNGLQQYDKEWMTMLAGGNGFFSVGAGPMLMYDSRDHSLNPNRGWYATAYAAFYTNYLPAMCTHTTYVVDARKYIHISPKTTLSIQGLGQFTEGHTPFLLLPYIGGDMYLRGYYKGQFTDNNLLLTQAEIKFPLYKRLGAAFFGGIAEVKPRLDDFNTSDYRYSWGTGLRYKLRKEDKTNIRLDIGFTPQGTGAYLIFAEAF